MDPKHDQTTNEAPPMRNKSKGGNAQPDPRAEMKIRKPEEDVLDVIQNVEAQLGALRKAHEDHRNAMASLIEQKKLLYQQGNELEQREQELTTREVELAEMRQQFEQREIDLVQRASGLEQRESKLASQAETLEQQEAELESRSGEIKRKITELDGQLAGISKRKGELDTLEREVQEKLAREETAAKKLAQAISELEHARGQLAQLDTKLEHNHSQLAERDAKLGQLSAERETLRAAHEKTCVELKGAVSKLRGREIELVERSKALEELAEQAGNIEQELSDTREKYERRIAGAEQQLTQLTEQLVREQQVSTGLRAQIESLEQQHGAEGDERVARLQSELGALQEQLQDAIAQAESLEQEGQGRGQADQLRIDSLTAELESTKTKLEEVNAQLGSIGAQADEELTAQRERVSDLEAQLRSLSEQIEHADALHSELEQQLAQRPKGDPQAEATLCAKIDEIAQAKASLEQALAERELQLGELGEQARSKIESLESQCSDLIATVERLNAELEDAQEQARQATGAEPERGDAWTELRRHRLQKMRGILRGDAEKVRLATEALRTRYEQCEQVLTKRAELAEAYEAIASAQRKYQNKEVRTGVVLGLFGMLAIMLVIGVSSWFVSGRVAPGMYRSRATLAATSPDGRLSEGDLAQWETYITGLTSDPRFLEVAAERMKRRGITEFASPGELGKHMGVYLDVAASMPGEIVFEYRDQGAERAQRVLDTFSVALTSASNNARARRVDTAVTTVRETASLSGEPLDTKRLEMAGIVFGSAVLSAMIVGGIIWRRLAAAKARFEKDSRVEVLYDEAKWKLPG